MSIKNRGGWNRSRQRRERNVDGTVLRLRTPERNGTGWTVLRLRTPRTERNGMDRSLTKNTKNGTERGRNNWKKN